MPIEEMLYYGSHLLRGQTIYFRVPFGRCEGNIVTILARETLRCVEKRLAIRPQQLLAKNL